MRNIIFILLTATITFAYNPLFSSTNNFFLQQDTVTGQDITLPADTTAAEAAVLPVDTLENETDTIITDSLYTEDQEIPQTEQDTTVVTTEVRDTTITRPPPATVIKKKKPEVIPELLYTVAFDSVLSLPVPEPKVYPGNLLFNEHLLTTRDIDPEKQPPKRSNWPVVILILSAALVGFARHIRPNGLKRTLNALFNNRNFFVLTKDHNVYGEWFSNLLIFNFFICVAMLFYQSIIIFGIIDIKTTFRDINFFLLILTFIIAFYLIKYAGLKILAYVFKTYNATNNYFVNLLVFNHMIGILLLPFLLYNMFYMNYYVQIFIWIIFILANVYKVFRSIILGHSISHFSMYYLFLYLCAVEIVPVLLIIKGSINYFNSL
ncbi:MAG: DUF4271 domain-containing protein [Bacteroidales bacterium]